MEHSIRIEPEIDRVRRESPLLRRKEAIEILAMVNHDVHQSSAFSVFWDLRVPSTQAQNSHTPLGAQVMAGGNTGGGQEGVLDLQSMLWRPVQRSHPASVGHEMSRGLETAQQSANSNGNGTQNEEILPSLQALLIDFRFGSSCKHTGLRYSF